MAAGTAAAMVALLVVQTVDVGGAAPPAAGTVAARVAMREVAMEVATAVVDLAVETGVELEVETVLEMAAEVITAVAPGVVMVELVVKVASVAAACTKQSRPQRASCCQCIHLMSSSPSRSHPLIRHSHGRIAAHPCPLAHLSTTEDQ